MDTSQTTHISLCSGYGGIDLGLRRVCPGLRTIAYAEIEAFAGQPQHTWEPPRVVGNARGDGRRKDQQGRETKERVAVDWSGKSVGNTESGNGQRSAQGQAGHAAQPDQETGHRQTQPTLGRDVDGITDRLDDAELYVTCDNRTDELRLLGNGVVPATAALAFRTLLCDLH